MIWLQQDSTIDSSSFVDSRWSSQGGPSFSAANAVFQFLPKELLQPCLLEPEVLQLYMSPDLLPQGPTGKRPRSVRAARVRSVQEQAGCFMAQYHYQHELPASHLQAKGLLGVLLDSPQGLRFYASPEVAISQGVSSPFLIDVCDRVAMRILGNALSGHQAVMVLALALQLFPAQAPGISPAKSVQRSVDATIRADNVWLLRVDAGWLMCKQEQAAALFASHTLRAQIATHLLPPETGFYEMHIRAGHGDHATSTRVQVSSHISPETFAKVVDIVPDLVIRFVDGLPCKIACAAHPRLLALHASPRSQAQDPVLLAWTSGQCFALHRGMPDFLQQLRHVFHTALDDQLPKAACYDVRGQRLHHAADMFGIVFVAPEVCEAPMSPAVVASKHLVGCRTMSTEASLCISVPASAAVDIYLAFPTHLLAAMGWTTQFSPFPKQDTDILQITVQPAVAPSPVQVLQIRHWLRIFWFVGALREMSSAAAAQSHSRSPMVKIECQLVQAMC